MHIQHRYRTITTWLALWTMVLGACLPTLSQAAVQLTDRQGWAEVCTSTGMVWVRAEFSNTATEPPSTPQNPSEASTQAGCTWCLAAGGHPALPPRPTVPFVGLSGVSVQVDSLSNCWVAITPHSQAQPRAPPTTL